MGSWGEESHGYKVQSNNTETTNHIEYYNYYESQQELAGKDHTYGDCAVYLCGVWTYLIKWALDGHLNTHFNHNRLIKAAEIWSKARKL